MLKTADSLQLAGSRKPEIRSFKDLIVWQKSMDLSIEIYRLTKKFPQAEQFGLVSQMRRCVVSIPSNIAEGKRRSTRKDFLQFLRIADGSASELETQLILASKLFSLQDTHKSYQLLEEVQRMLGGMLKRLSLQTVSSKLPTSNLYD